MSTISTTSHVWSALFTLGYLLLWTISPYLSFLHKFTLGLMDIYLFSEIRVQYLVHLCSQLMPCLFFFFGNYKQKKRNSMFLLVPPFYRKLHLICQFYANTHLPSQFYTLVSHFTQVMTLADHFYKVVGHFYMVMISSQPLLPSDGGEWLAIFMQ